VHGKQRLGNLVCVSSELQGGKKKNLFLVVPYKEMISGNLKIKQKKLQWSSFLKAIF